MFLSGDRLERRERKVRSFLRNDPAIAVLLAAASFEWTLSRAVLWLSGTPNKKLRNSMARCYGLGAYKDLWKDEVTAAGHPGRLTGIVTSWSLLTNAFKERGKLVHGNGTTTTKKATPHVEAMLQASCDLAAYCEAHGIADFHGRLRVRRVRTGPRKKNST